MIKIGLCDDNTLYIKELSKILKTISHCNNINIEITSFTSGEDLIEFSSCHPDYFDVVFLDILMGGINGIHTAKAIRKIYNDVYIIFVTTSKEYALDSYSVNAYDYVIKPFSEQLITEKFLALCNKINLDRKNIIYVKSNQDIYTLQLNNVIYFESNLRKITAHMNNSENIAFYNKMSNLENEISSSIFIRCHRSFLVNLIYIKNIVGLDIVLTNNTHISISKKYLNDVKDAFTSYIRAKL
ncbi:response regulator transcription factor [Clostridium botulinum]|uniref:LytR/AlgR family response regulator transcription factor n=1 Tax=Clostridium botulinum TaxID=1491 RepID=UPI0013F09DFD|nr:LytTR family DNA-binding domain-containing protein [Clostridium botulinum]NFG24330.1 response regulator transcription factor [Clostridium botulinum]NFO05506.1 response regulator transcription factor [Clostridium botulinum]NFR15836.1 response regulator transcription factor [Clostridium botulinum]NFR44816.1 response regulator transcription factor [Clostridium botulinum]NFS51300.1 response regulator transcription factor [Clostridium botulinum]